MPAFCSKYFSLWLILAACLAAGCGGDSAPAEKATDSASGGSAAVERGATLFSAMGCTACHREDDAALGARLHGIAGTEVTLADGRTVVRDADYLARAIRQPGADKVPGLAIPMPAYPNLSDDDIAALVAYVQSLR